ncbi:MAG: hypothetical protein V4580_17240 [Bacteroidota bacterium]
MKSDDEELIQQLIEDQQKGRKEFDWIPYRQEDIDAYQILFQELSNENCIAGDFTLAEKVTRKISRKQQKAESVKYVAVLLTIITVFTLFTCLSIMFVDPAFIQIIFNVVATHNKVLLFIILILIANRLLDKVFIKEEAQSLSV